MNIRLLILCALSCVGTSAYAQLLLPVKQNGRWGFCDSTGNLRIALQYDFAGDFQPNGLAPVKKDGNAYLIDKKGETVSEGNCKDMHVISNGIYACYNGNEWKFHGPSLGTPPPYHIRAMKNADAFWIIYTAQGCGLMDSRARMVVKPEYDDIAPAKKSGYFLLYKDSLMGVADINGKELLPVKYRFTDFVEPGLLIFHSGEKLGVMTLDGRIATDTIYNDYKAETYYPFVLLYEGNRATAYHLSSGNKFVCDSLTQLNFFDGTHLLLYLPDGLNLLDMNMQRVLKKQYNSIRNEHAGYTVSRNGRFGFCNKDGEEVHAPRYGNISTMISNTAITHNGRLRGIIHSGGAVVAEPLYNKVEIYSETAKLYTDSSVITIDFDATGKELYRSEFKNFKTIRIGGYKDYRKPDQTSNDPAPSVWFLDPATKKWGLHSATGEVLITPRFSEVRRWSSTLSLVSIDVKGSCTLAGQYTLPYTKLLGLVQDGSGAYILPPTYINIHKDSDNPDDEKNIIAVDPAFNFYIVQEVVKEGYKKFGPFKWVGKRYGTHTPVATGGTWKSLHPDTTYTSNCTVLEFLHGCLSSQMLNMLPMWKWSTGELVLTDATYGIWKFDYDKPGKIPDKTFGYLSDFKNGYAVAGKSGRFGVVDVKGDTVVPIEYNRIQIVTQNESVFFLKYNRRNNYGFVKDDGSWAFERKFAQPGFFSDGMAFMGYENNGFVYVDTGGNVSYTQGLTRSGHFTEGLAPVRGKKYWHYIDKAMNPVLEGQPWTRAGQFSGGLAVVRTGLDYRYIHTDGSAAFGGSVFQRAENFRDGLAPVMPKKHWGLMDTKGQYVVKPKYTEVKYAEADDLYYFHNKGWYIYSPDGTPLNKKPVTGYKPFNNGRCLVTFANGKAAVMHKNGRLSYPPDGTGIVSLQGNFMVVSPAPGYVALGDTSFAPLTPDKTYRAFKFGGDEIIFALTRKGTWEALDTDGKFLFSVPGKPMSGYENGFASVFTNNKQYIFINTKGEQAFGMFFNGAQPFGGGMAKVYSGNRWGMIDTLGAFVCMPKYKSIGPFREGLAAVQLENVIAISKNNNTPLVPGEYDSVTLYPNGYFRVESADKVGWISRSGVVVWEPRN